MTLKQIEILLLAHLQESGEIRSDLKWLKKSYWYLVIMVGGAIVTEIVHLIWK